MSDTPARTEVRLVARHLNPADAIVELAIDAAEERFEQPDIVVIAHSHGASARAVKLTDKTWLLRDFRPHDRPPSAWYRLDAADGGSVPWSAVARWSADIDNKLGIDPSTGPPSVDAKMHGDDERCERSDRA